MRYISYNKDVKGVNEKQVKRRCDSKSSFMKQRDGRIPVQEFLDSLDPKMNAKMIGLMEILEEKGFSSASRIPLRWKMEYLS